MSFMRVLLSSLRDDAESPDVALRPGDETHQRHRDRVPTFPKFILFAMARSRPGVCCRTQPLPFGSLKKTNEFPSPPPPVSIRDR
jgi:hypothetical protein